MPAPQPEETTIDCLPFYMLTEVLFRVPTAAALVHAAGTKRSWRDAIANDDFLAHYRQRHNSSPFLGVYVPRQTGGPPVFHMPDSISRLAKGDDLYDAANRAFNLGQVRRYQDHRLPDADDAFILGHLPVHQDCRFLDCHNGRLLLTRGNEALEVRSPLARETILLPLPPHVVDPDCLQAACCLLQGHDGSAASFRVVHLEHRRRGRDRQARAVEYDSTKTWQDHPWETLHSYIRGTPQEVMHAGHRIFCTYSGHMSAAVLLDTNNMHFSVLSLPSAKNFVIREGGDNTCCFVESDGCADHRLRMWQLHEEKLDWGAPVKNIEMCRVIGEQHVGYYRPCAIANGTALLCSATTHQHFVIDLKTCSVKDKFEFQGQFAYLMKMPWPPVFSSSPTTNGARSPGRSPIVEVNMPVGSSVLASAGSDASLQGSISEPFSQHDHTVPVEPKSSRQDSPNIPHCADVEGADHVGSSNQSSIVFSHEALSTASEPEPLPDHEALSTHALPTDAFEPEPLPDSNPVAPTRRSKRLDWTEKEEAGLKRMRQPAALKQKSRQMKSSNPIKPPGKCTNSVWAAEEVSILRVSVEKFRPKNGGRIPWAQVLKSGSDVFQSTRQQKDLKNKWNHMKRTRQRRYVTWGKEEEATLRKAVPMFTPQDGAPFPWARILEYGRRVFKRTRLPLDLRDKWRNLEKADAKLQECK